MTRMTRAEFIRRLLEKKGVRVYVPELRQVQPITKGVER